MYNKGSEIIGDVANVYKILNSLRQMLLFLSINTMFLNFNLVIP